MSTYQINGPEDFRLIPQKKTRAFFFKGEEDHNSIWDTTMGPDGKLYLSLSSELTNGGWARLYEYDYKTNTARKLLNAEDVICPQDRAIRASKFHTSISFLDDHTLVMSTHMTDRAPQHPTWMPFSFFGNMWEGFAGSNIVKYDLLTGKAENLGIPAVHESLYGSCLDKAHQAFWSMGYLKGHLYRYDFKTHRAKDFGKVSETASFRLVPGPDGNLYSTSNSGYLFKIDTEAQKIVDMNYRVPFYTYGPDYTFRNAIANVSCGVTGPDGRVYLAFMYGPQILALDTKTGEVEEMGNYLNTPRFAVNENRNGIFGMDFDDKGRLWYFVEAPNNGEEVPKPACPAGLFSWDILKKGARPVFRGIIGVSECVSGGPSMMYIHENHLLCVEQFHGHMAPCVYTIDLSQYDSGEDVLVKVDPDTLIDKAFHTTGDDRFAHSKPFDDNSAITDANPHQFQGKLENFWRIWRALAPDHIEDSAVRKLVFDEDGTLYGLSGKEKEYLFCIRDGKLQIAPVDETNAARASWVKEQANTFTEASKKKLPHYPGRQFMATATAETGFTGGRRVVGTRDGLLAVVDGDKVHSYGMCGYNGPVRDLATTPDGRTVYGVAGDEEDLGMVFRLTEEAGLELLGMIHNLSSKLEGPVSSNVLSACAISPEGKYLAIGWADRIAAVYLYRL